MRVLQWIALVIFSWSAGYMLAMFWTALGLPPLLIPAALFVFGLLWLFNEFRNAPLEQGAPDETVTITRYLIKRRTLYRFIQADLMRAIANYRRKAQAQEQTEA